MGDGSPADAGTRVCPYCAETIQAAARVCRFCGREVRRRGPAQRAWRSVQPPREPRWLRGLNRYFSLLGLLVLGALALAMCRLLGA